MHASNSLDRHSVLYYFRSVGTRAALAAKRPNPFFRGRDAELDALHANVAYAVDGLSDNRTAIVSGTPGVGKSELMLHFLNQLPSVHGSNVIGVDASYTSLGNAPAFLNELLVALPSGHEYSTATRKLKQEISELKGFSIAGFGITRGEGQAAPATSKQESNTYWFNQSCEELPHAIRDHVFVVCVDEFQNLKTPADSLCGPLHLASLGLKIVPVYFGLSNAPDVLSDAEVSRMEDDNNVPLAAITTNAGTTLLNEFLDTLSVECDVDVDREQLVAETAKRCSCWPHHLTSWMRAACDVLPDYDFKMTSESRSEIDLGCDLYRTDYYADRLSGCRFLEDREPRKRLGSLLQDQQVVSRLDIANTIKPLIEESGMDFDITEFMNEAIHCGVLVRSKSGGYEAPIPSLVNFLLDSDKN